jgi:hypothetical protein
MTIIHKGIRRKTTDVIDDYGQAYYAQNLRFRRTGEMGRRGGIGKTDMAQQAGPVLLITCGSYYEPYIAQVIGDTVVTTLNPLAKWADPLLPPPDGEVGNPVAPVINFITPNPTSPPATYVVGVVTFTADVTYDGLSGPLSYAWSTPTGGTSAVVIVNNANPASFNFDATCFPDSYAYTLTVTAGAFVVPFPTAYTVL